MHTDTRIQELSAEATTKMNAVAFLRNAEVELICRELEELQKLVEEKSRRFDEINKEWDAQIKAIYREFKTQVTAIENNSERKQ